jgi:hypothetical protein
MGGCYPFAVVVISGHELKLANLRGPVFSARKLVMSEVEYGAVYIIGGRYKGRVLYYDDDEFRRTAICYIGHPINFPVTVDIPLRFLREPTIDELLRRREELWRTLTNFAIDNLWDIEPEEVHHLWAEKSLIDDVISERQFFGLTGHLGGKVVFLCHSSADKGRVRMIHDDLMHRGANCWLDENKIKVGDSIVGKISDGLKASQTMIVFLSPKSVRSTWATKEWQAFLARHLSEGSLKILPALLEECEIPSILADLKYADFTEGYQHGLKQIFDGLE